MKIDAHQHYWLLNRGDYGWLSPEAGVLYEDYMPERLMGHLQSQGIRQTIVVQAAPTIAEAEFLLKIAAAEGSIAGVVGWMDLESKDFERDLTRLRANPLFVGIRPSWPLNEEGLLNRSERLLQSLNALANNGMSIDLLLPYGQLPELAALLDEVPELRVVVDHLGGPTYRAEDREDWACAIERISRNANVYCKMSGMMNHVRERSEEEALHLLTPYIRHLLAYFGPSRLMFGSDWPLCLLGGEYADTVRLFEKLISVIHPEPEWDELYGGNAASFYRIEGRGKPYE